MWLSFNFCYFCSFLLSNSLYGYYIQYIPYGGNHTVNTKNKLKEKREEDAPQNAGIISIESLNLIFSSDSFFSLK